MYGSTSSSCASAPVSGRTGRPGNSGIRSFRFLSASGVSIEDIADAVGHVNSTVTKTTYRHQIVDEVTAVATAMDAIFGDASRS